MGQHNDRSNKITRKVNPKFGYLGILGFMGFLGIWSYQINKDVFPFIFFAFFGFFMPFYLLQAPVKELKKHGIIQFIISAVGVGLSFYIMLH